MGSFEGERGSWRLVAGPAWRLLGIALLLLLVGACGQERKLQLGDPAPDFSAVDQHGNRISMAELAGRPVVLRFWSVDCKYCRADTPVFNDYYRRYQDQGLMIIYVSRNEDQAMVQRFIADLEIEFPVIIDRDGLIAEKYRVKLDPQAIFIDPQNRLTAAVLGGVGEAELERLIGGYLQ
ncbi:peroxiredoxin family protein [Desulfurivibrio sp. C05AmB]|uniref:peroxiredoxin family protein n=1 Tax=Desulfurivibrio sp. C05AmB TaxID=3374371 RepID=UPI00376F22B1